MPQTTERISHLVLFIEADSVRLTVWRGAWLDNPCICWEQIASCKFLVLLSNQESGLAGWELHNRQISNDSQSLLKGFSVYWIPQFVGNLDSLYRVSWTILPTRVMTRIRLLPIRKQLYNAPWGKFRGSLASSFIPIQNTQNKETSLLRSSTKERFRFTRLIENIKGTATTAEKSRLLPRATDLADFSLRYGFGEIPRESFIIILAQQVECAVKLV